MTFFEQSVFFGVSVSLAAYGIGVLLQKKFKFALFNPLLISVVLTIAVLLTAHISYDTFYEGAQYLSYLLTPATVCLAVPLYEKLSLLKSNWKAIFAGILSGVITTLCSVFVMSKLFHLTHEEYVTLLPKSITTAIGMGVSEELGGGAPVTIQSMCNTHTEDAKATIAQIHALEEAGCEIVRVTVPNMVAAHALSEIKENISIPLVADIHFDYRLAVEAAARGADKIRINPGNIGGDDRVKAVVDACREHKVPIRIGVNGGSLEKELLAKYGRVTPEALVESALRHVRLLEKFDFTEICISVKSSDVPLNMAAYRLLHEKVDYPLHLGVTEAGTPTMGLLKSAIGIGGLLCEGIGDTMRVSLTADPVEEVYAAKRILQACGIRRSGVNLVSCPTCGRTAYDMIPIAEELERRLADCKKNITVAVMGCVVNGPGEASAADIGVAGGKGEGMIFRKGKILYKVPQEKLVDALMEEIKKL